MITAGASLRDRPRRVGPRQRAGTRLRAAAGLAIVLTLAAGIRPAFAPDRARLRVLFTPDIFSTVNRNDALAAARAWIEAVGKKRGLELEVEVNTYDTVEGLRRSVDTHSADLFVMSTMHYLDLESSLARLDPVFLPQRGSVLLDAYVLLSGPDGPESLAELRGKKVLFLRTAGTNLSRLWLETELSAEGLGDAGEFCGSVEEVPKPSSAILPVFFGQADACVVDETSFALMQELNPQVGKALAVRRRSPPLLETVICVHRNHLENRQDLIDGLATLHEEPNGRQILLVFRIERLVPYDAEALRSVRELRDRVAGQAGMASQ